MHEERRCAGRRQRRRDLARDVPGLANAGHDDAPAAVEQRPGGSEKRCAEALGKRGDRGSFGGEHVAAERKRALRLDAACGGRSSGDRCGHAGKYTGTRAGP